MTTWLHPVRNAEQHRAITSAQPNVGSDPYRPHAGALTKNENSYYTELLKKVDATDETLGAGAVYLQGSIAEGFGNPFSDVDLVYVFDQDIPVPLNRDLLFVDGRRIELFRMRLSDLLELATLVNSWSDATDVSFDSGQLHRYQQVGRWICLRDKLYAQAARRSFVTVHCERLVMRFFELEANRYFERARLALSLGRCRRGKRYVRQAMLHCAKAWCASRSETYMSLKSAPLQLRRASFGDVEWAHYRTLLDRVESGLRSGDLEACTAFWISKGVALLRAPSEEVWAKWSPGVNFETVASGAYLFAGNRVFAVTTRAQRSIALLGLTQAAPVEISSKLQSNDTRAVVSQLHDYGLMALGGSRLGENWTLSGAVRPPMLDRPMMSPRGAILPTADHTSVYEVGLSPHEFATVGAELNWAHVMIDNYREDIAGALAVSQWDVIELSYRRMAIALARILLAAHGIPPPLDGYDPEESLEALDSLPKIDRNLVEKLLMLEGWKVRCESDVFRAGEHADAILDGLVPDVRASYLRGTHLDQRVFEYGKSLGHSWIELIARIGGGTTIADAAQIIAANQLPTQ